MHRPDLYKSVPSVNLYKTKSNIVLTFNFDHSTSCSCCSHVLTTAETPHHRQSLVLDLEYEQLQYKQRPRLDIISAVFLSYPEEQLKQSDRAFLGRILKMAFLG